MESFVRRVSTMTRTTGLSMAAIGGAVVEEESAVRAVTGTITAPASPVRALVSNKATGAIALSGSGSEEFDDSDPVDGSLKRMDDLKPVRHTNPRQSDQNQSAGGVEAGFLITSDCQLAQVP